LAPRDDFSARGHPGPGEVWLVVDTTLRWDRTVQRPLYAAAGVPEWIVDLEWRWPRSGAELAVLPVLTES